MSGKRVSHELLSAGGLAKKAKDDLVQTRCAELQKVIRSSQAREDARDALAVIMPFCLSVAKDDRDKFQHEAVGMIGDVLQQEEVYLEGCVAKAVASTDSPTQEVQAQDAAVKKAERELAAARDVAHEAKLALAVEARAFLAAKRTFADAENARDVCDTECRLADKNKGEARALANQIDTLYTTHDKIPEFMLNLASHVELEDSMQKAVAATLGVNPRTRGPFDTLVLQQLMDKLNRRVGALQQLIDNSEMTLEDRAVAVQSASAVLAQARESQTSSAKRFIEARDKAAILEAAAIDMQKELRALAKKASDAAVVAADARKTLDEFRSCPLAAYAELRDN